MSAKGLDALTYMRDLPEGRRVFHCAKHQLYQEECEGCRVDFAEWCERHELARRHHRELEGTAL